MWLLLSSNEANSSHSKNFKHPWMRRSKSWNVAQVDRAHCCAAIRRLDCSHDRPRKEPLLRPRGALCARRYQHGRGCGEVRGEPAVRTWPRSRQERVRSGGGTWRAEGPDHEGRAADGDHPGSAAARIRRETAKTAERRAADGLAVREAAHDRGAWLRLAGEIRRVRAQARRRRLARAGAPRAIAG